MGVCQFASRQIRPPAAKACRSAGSTVCYNIKDVVVLKMRVKSAMLLALAALMCGNTAARPSRGLLQSFPVAPNTTGVENAGFVFGSDVGGELAVLPSAGVCCLPLAACIEGSACSGCQPRPCLTWVTKSRIQHAAAFPQIDACISKPPPQPVLLFLRSAHCDFWPS